MIYISGKIADSDEVKLHENLEKFFSVEKRLGIDPSECFNPARLPQNNTYEYLLTRCLLEIFEKKPDMYFMIGWEESRGARLEHELAKQLNLKIEYEKAI